MWLNAAVPVGGLGGDERPQGRECRVDRICAISLPGVGGVPLASLPDGRRHRRAMYARHGSHVDPSAQLPLPVHLDVKAGRRRGGQPVGCGVAGVGAALLGARALAAVLLVVFGEEGNVAVQKAAGWRGRAQHGKCHLGWALPVSPCWTSASSARFSVCFLKVFCKPPDFGAEPGESDAAFMALTPEPPGRLGLLLLVYAKTHHKCHLFS